MDSLVHRNLTRAWATQEGFSPTDAHALGLLTDGVDAHKGDFVHPWNWKYHYARHGAFDNAARELSAACGDPLAEDAFEHVAIALHGVQDGVGHRAHGPSSHPSRIDDWNTTAPATQGEIERLSRLTLRTYLAARRLAEEQQVLPRAEAGDAAKPGEPRDA
jgi:hypothetical protein